MSDWEIDITQSEIARINMKKFRQREHTLYDEMRELESEYWYPDNWSFSDKIMLENKLKEYLRSFNDKHGEVLHALRTDNGGLAHLLFTEILKRHAIFGQCTNYYEFENMIFRDENYHHKLMYIRTEMPKTEMKLFVVNERHWDKYNGTDPLVGYLKTNLSAGAIEAMIEQAINKNSAYNEDIDQLVEDIQDIGFKAERVYLEEIGL
jgi:hypothetical protein